MPKVREETPRQPGSLEAADEDRGRLGGLCGYCSLRGEGRCEERGLDQHISDRSPSHPVGNTDRGRYPAAFKLHGSESPGMPSKVLEDIRESANLDEVAAGGEHHHISIQQEHCSNRAGP